jgi:hypothetical protein
VGADNRGRHRRRTRDHCGGARPGPQARRLRPPGAPGDHGLAGRAPRRPQPGRGRVGRGRAAVRDRAHPGGGQDRLAPGPERPGRAGLRERRGLRPADVVQGHLPRHHRRVLRRQLQLVGRLRALGLHPLRPPGRAPAGRRPPEVGGGGPPAHHRGAPAPARRLPGDRARRHHHPGLPRAGPRARPRGRAAGRRTLARRVLGRAAGHARLPPGGRAARRPHPRRGQRALEAGGQRGRHLQAGRGAARHLPGRAWTHRRRRQRSSHTWFVLSQLLGLPRVRNYDGSWVEWGNSVRVPIERSSEPGPDPRLKAVG